MLRLPTQHLRVAKVETPSSTQKRVCPLRRVYYVLPGASLAMCAVVSSTIWIRGVKTLSNMERCSSRTISRDCGDSDERQITPYMYITLDTI
eukprot:5739128-Pyramimonas_sp.AAC.2